MEGGVKLDRWGYEINTSSDACISALNSYYHQVLSYGRDRRVILEAARQDKGCVLANVLAAHFLASSDPPRAPDHYQAAKSRLEEATQYERAVFDAVSSLICEDRDDDVALGLHSKLLDEYPKDLVSVKRAQVLCFYMGRPDLSLDLVEKVILKNEQEDYVHGMLAFPLLELGRMADAEEAARKGYHINNHDYWSQHAICHVLQYECRFKEAVEFMELCSPTWSSCSSFMLTHNWWHVALCYLEGHSSVRKVVEVYDEHIWKELDKDDSSPAEVYLNALGLLLRLYVRGEYEALGDRLKVLSELVSDQAHWYLECHLDLYIIWALSQAGERSKAEELLDGLKSRISKKSKKKQQRMQRAVLLAEAMFEYGNRNNERALELLGPTFDAKECKMVGASDEQLDVFNEVWFSMLLDSGRTTTAIEALTEQIKKREGSPYLWRLLEKGYAMTGSEDAAAAGDKARALEATHFS